MEQTVALVDETPVPLYQRISDQAVHLRRLGMTYGAIAAALQTDATTVSKAVRWGVLPDSPEWQTLVTVTARYRSEAPRICRLRRDGLTLRQIGEKVGLSAPMVLKALKWAEQTHARREEGGNGDV